MHLRYVHDGESSKGSLVCDTRYAAEHPRLERPGLYHVRGLNPSSTPFSCMHACACASGPIDCTCGGAPATGCVATVILLLQLFESFPHQRQRNLPLCPVFVPGKPQVFELHATNTSRLPGK